MFHTPLAPEQRNETPTRVPMLGKIALRWSAGHRLVSDVYEHLAPPELLPNRHHISSNSVDIDLAARGSANFNFPGKMKFECIGVDRRR